MSGFAMRMLILLGVVIVIESFCVRYKRICDVSILNSCSDVLTCNLNYYCTDLLLVF